MKRPTLAVWKFASCDGCQLTLLDCEDELLALAEQVEIRHFLEASSAVAEGPYDVSLVEGSITTEHDIERIERIREQSGLLVTIGACATAGGIQALRNAADIADYTAAVYAHPEYIATLATSTPIAEHVQVDFALHGCPIDKGSCCKPWLRCCAAACPDSRTAACARSASGVAPSACSSGAACPASGPSPAPAAARSARPTTAAASAASARSMPPTSPHCASS